MKNIIITGAGGNLGLAVTHLFLDEGYQVIAVAAADAKENFIAHSNLEIFTTDLSDEKAAGEFIGAAVSKYGKIDAGILLVGGFAAGNIADTSGEDISKQIHLNFNTAYFTTRPLYKHFQEQKAGRFVFIGSRPALDPAFGKDLVAYSLSKSLLFRLAEYINEESRGTDITATVIAPSTLDTALNRKSMPKADPGKWVKPLDLAEIIQFVISDKSSVLRETVLKAYNKS